MITKLILFLHQLLSVEDQQAVTLLLVSVVYPGSHVHLNPKRKANET
jgi:hypothetical protein